MVILTLHIDLKQNKEKNISESNKVSFFLNGFKPAV